MKTNYTIAQLIQGSDEWLEWRTKGISATDIPIILGLSPYKTAYRLWLEKTGRANADDLSGNPNVQRGNRLESIARSFFEDRDDEILLPICAELNGSPLRASLDGFSNDGIPYELKSPHESTFDDIEEKGTESEAYKLYELQVKAQCTVVDSNVGKLLFYMEDKRHLDFTITTTDEDMETIRATAQEFWDLIQSDTPPPLDPERDLYIPSSGQDEFKWQSYAEIYIDNQVQLKALEDLMKPLKEAQKELQSAMVEMMGDFCTTDYAGVKVTRFTKKGLIDYKKLLAEHNISPEEQEKFRKQGAWQSRVTLSEKDKVLNTDVIGNETKPTQGAGYF